MREQLDDWFQDLKSVLTGPSEFFEQLEDYSLGQSAKFAGLMGALIGGLIGLVVILFGVVSPGATGTSAVTSVVIGLLMPVLLGVFYILNAFISGALMHVVAYALGMRDVEKTVSAFTYSLSITVISWIPLINFLAAIYSLYIQYVGIKKLHDTTPFRAFIVAISLPVAGMLLYIALLVMVLAGSTAPATVPAQ
ncbi:YIP1 family protein [Candidatus Nanohalococcus occultus]|uniref:Membrane protein, Yip1 family n=1 Tax=Candidatus Nanohalococcus occultus TaxID=2978047 RepID=A0ABY8CJ92_9ARCH|nr:putative membrane protein, Yip1 family [Candidatus Nanohaloarchaeota archaeon SVXNc]